MKLVRYALAALAATLSAAPLLADGPGPDGAPATEAAEAGNYQVYYRCSANDPWQSLGTYGTEDAKKVVDNMKALGCEAFAKRL